MILFLLFTIKSLFAITGNYSSSEFELPSTCKIKFQYKQYDGKKVSGLCSSSFIGHDKFITADHCKEDIWNNLGQADMPPPMVECPGEKSFEIERTFNPSNSGFTNFQDVLLVQTKKKVEGIEAVKIPRDKNHINELLGSKENCYINGYGIDNEGKYGVLKSAQITDMNLKPSTFGQESSGKVVRINGNLGVHGDSGGPLFCKEGKDAYLAGIIHGSITGADFTDIERIDQYIDWLNHIALSGNVDEDFYKAWYGSLGTCESVNKCYDEIQKLGQLTEDVTKIVSKIEENYVRALKDSKSVNPDKNSAEYLHDSLIEFWTQFDCYNKLYP